MVWNLFRARRTRQPVRPRPAFKARRPRVEALEDRYVLSTFHWVGNTDGNFNVAANWQPSGVPGPNDDAFIDNGGFNVTVPASAAVNSLTDNARLIIPGGVTLTLANVTATSRLTALVLNGAVRTTGGVTVLTGGSALAGNLDVAAGATLVFGGSTTHNLNAGATLTNTGNFQIAGPVSVNANLTAAPVMELANNGDLTGPATLTSSGTFNWTGGNMTGTGATVITGNLNLSEENKKQLERRTLTTTNKATILPSDDGPLDSGDGAIWNIPAGAVVDIQSNILIRLLGGNPPGVTINNHGTIQKSGGTGTTDLQNVILNNDGVLDVQVGTLLVDSSGASTGSFTVAAGANLLFTRDTYTWRDGTSLGGDGAVTLAAGTVAVQGSVTAQNITLSGSNLTGTGTLTVEGAFNWTNGGMSDVGVTVIDTSATLTISGGNEKSLSQRTLTTLGNTVIAPSGTGTINTGNGAVWNNSGLIDDQANLLIRWNFGTFPALTLNNAGTFQKSAGAGSTDFQRVIVNNAGLLDVQVGTVQLDEGGASTGSFTMEAGANLLFTRNTYTVNDGSSFGGDGTVTLAAGMVAVQGSVMAQNVTLAGGNLGGAGTLTVEGAFNWTDGGMSGLGTTYIDTNAALTISSGNDKFLDGRTLTTAGNTVIAPSGTGTINTGNGAVWNNSGLIDDQASLLFRWNFGTFPALTFNNTGTFQKSAGTGATTFQNVIVNNDGEFDVLAGVVDLDGGGASTGTFNAAAGTMLQFSRSTYVLNAGSNLPGAGFVQVISGVLSLNTQVSVANLAVVGGTLEIGNSGMLNVTGAYSQTSALLVHLIGTTAGAGYGQLNVGGNASISGSLTVVYDGDFQPNVGDSFRLVTFGSLNGSFSQLFLPGLAPNRHWTSSYDASGFTLAVAAG